MNSIHDVADYIISRVKSEDENASLINLKLQKLLYYVQAWSYGINKKRISSYFPNPISPHPADPQPSATHASPKSPPPPLLSGC